MTRTIKEQDKWHRDAFRWLMLLEKQNQTKLIKIRKQIKEKK